jgi:sugar/nucleoside kinase (ribokinase family)
VLARTDLLSLNERELGILTGLSDVTNVREAARSLIGRLASGGYVVARVGAQGCWLVSETLAPSHFPGRPVQAVDTTGAGDTHVAALLARLAAGDEIQTAAMFANVAAALSVERVGPATCPTIKEVFLAMQS